MLSLAREEEERFVRCVSNNPSEEFGSRERAGVFVCGRVTEDGTRFLSPSRETMFGCVGRSVELNTQEEKKVVRSA